MASKKMGRIGRAMFGILWIATVVLSGVIGYQLGRYQQLDAGAPPSSTADRKAPSIDERTGPPAGPEEVNHQRFFVQVHSFEEKRTAEEEVATLVDAGYPAVVQAHSKGRQTVYRVRIGPYDNRQDARVAMNELVAGGYSTPWLVEESPPPGE